ncbi:endochitinase A-like isoform X2 [Protopterus annectens]|uniref:endochitinase A-like isoform X2 n=1 Tax=Protopterus annectens TaxID=7888 RepID=UPI001CFABD17|nr:endochitinase A-like isoform X2 [Protopterus annectens]
MKGNWLTVQRLLDTLKKRQGWVPQLINALEKEKSELADDLRRTYEQFQNPSSSPRCSSHVQPSLNSVSSNSSHHLVPSAHPPYAAPPPSVAASYPVSHLPPSALQSSELQPSPPPSYISLQCMPSASRHPQDNMPINPVCLDSPRLPQNNESNSQLLPSASVLTENPTVIVPSQSDIPSASVPTENPTTTVGPSQSHVPSASVPTENPTTTLIPSQSHVPSASVPTENPTTTLAPSQSCHSNLIGSSTTSPNLPVSSLSVAFSPAVLKVNNSSTQTSFTAAAAHVPDTVLHASEPSSRFSSVFQQASMSEGSSHVENGGMNSYLKAPVQETVTSNPEPTFSKERKDTRAEGMNLYEKAPIQENVISNPDHSFPVERRNTGAKTKQENTDTQLHAVQQNQGPSGQGGQEPVRKKQTVANPFQTAAVNPSSSEQSREIPDSTQANNIPYEDFSKPGILMSTPSEIATVSHCDVDQTREGYSGNSDNLQISSSQSESDIERDLEVDPLQISTSSNDGTTCRVPEEDDYMCAEQVSKPAVQGVNNTTELVEESLALWGNGNTGVLNNLGNISNPLLLQQQVDASENVTQLGNVNRSGSHRQLDIDHHHYSNTGDYRAQLPVSGNSSSRDSVFGSKLTQSNNPHQMPAEYSDVETYSIHFAQLPDVSLQAGNERLNSTDTDSYLDRSSFPREAAPSESGNCLYPKDHASSLSSETSCRPEDDTESRSKAEPLPINIRVFSVIAVVAVSAFLVWRYIRK